MNIWTRFKKWLNTPPNEDDFFFVHIRQTYQAFKLLRKNRKNKHG